MSSHSVSCWSLSTTDKLQEVWSQETNKIMCERKPVRRVVFMIHFDLRQNRRGPDSRPRYLLITLLSGGAVRPTPLCSRRINPDTSSRLLRGTLQVHYEQHIPGNAMNVGLYRTSQWLSYHISKVKHPSLNNRASNCWTHPNVCQSSTVKSHTVQRKEHCWKRVVKHGSLS